MTEHHDSALLQVGLLGGTFDPIHRGHVHVALRVAERFNLDQIWFLVARTPPHKGNAAVSNCYHRYAMTVLELQSYPHLFASTLELEREGPSYTIDTLRVVARRWPEYRFVFLAGSDSLRDIRSWKDYATLFKKYTLIFVQRPGVEVNLQELSLPSEIKQILEQTQGGSERSLRPGRSFLLDVNAPPVSSTQLRKSMARGDQLPTEFLSESVLTYLKKHRLYHEDKKDT